MTFSVDSQLKRDFTLHNLFLSKSGVLDVGTAREKYGITGHIQSSNLLGLNCVPQIQVLSPAISRGEEKNK